MKKSLVYVLCLVVAFSLVAAGCGGKKEEPKKAEGKKISIKMSVTTPSDSSPWNIAAKKWAELVKERTKGRVEITTFPNEQLSSGNQQKGIEQVASGVTGASIHSTIIYSVIEPKLAVADLPDLVQTGIVNADPHTVGAHLLERAQRRRVERGLDRLGDLADIAKIEILRRSVAAKIEVDPATPVRIATCVSTTMMCVRRLTGRCWRGPAATRMATTTSGKCGSPGESR